MVHSVDDNVEDDSEGEFQVPDLSARELEEYFGITKSEPVENSADVSTDITTEPNATGKSDSNSPVMKTINSTTESSSTEDWQLGIAETEDHTSSIPAKSTAAISSVTTTEPNVEKEEIELYPQTTNPMITSTGNVTYYSPNF
ncbi:hypothetical protein D915_005772 [Fasciola hepatica]|uniref:Uncharacterized protein n=1 Tax=Fasciola hepatica TaxID=6192 RepID=A0A4E0R975_FASHE|nr:hypothetical protein D915_005772 [Fasciola hepatica]